jgi:hypothetical protein
MHFLSPLGFRGTAFLLLLTLFSCKDDFIIDQVERAIISTKTPQNPKDKISKILQAKKELTERKLKDKILIGK